MVREAMSFAAPSDDYVHKVYTFDLGSSFSGANTFTLTLTPADQLPQDRWVALSATVAAAGATTNNVGSPSAFEFRLYDAISTSQAANYAAAAVPTEGESYVVLGWLVLRRPWNGTTARATQWEPAATVVGRNVGQRWRLVIQRLQGGGSATLGPTKMQIQLRTGGALNDHSFTL